MLAFQQPSFQVSREMPIDTFRQLGTSPPSFNFFYSFQRLSLNSSVHSTSMHLATNTGQSVSKVDLDLPRRSCLRILDKSSEVVSFCESSEFTEDKHSLPVFDETEPCHIDEKMTALTPDTEKHQKLKPGKKKVCFADSKGLRLHTVRIMDGPSDTPPLLNVNLFKEVIQNERAEPNHPYTYVPDFDQPASNYLDFRERLERNNVCLENVMIKDNIRIMGTVKVRNISFEKSVKIRVTFDEWKTFRDVPASYVFPSCNLGEEKVGASDKYDTFSFHFDLPPNLGGRAAYFCISYMCNQTTFWDNNKDINYRIISLQEKETSEHERMVNHYQNLSGEYPWTDVSFYNLADNERPYW